MRQIIYGDVLFLFNFSIDFLVLLLVGCFLSLRRRLLRLLPAALLGGAYAVLILLPDLSPAVSITLNILMAILMCVIAYAPLGGGTFLKTVVLFYAVSVLLGGAVQALCNLLAAFFGTGGLESTVSGSDKAEIFMLYAVISGVVIFLAGRILSRNAGLENIMLQIEEGGKTITLNALLDSGNFLRDPASGRPVILVRQKNIESFLPSGVPRALGYGGRGDTLPPSVMRKIRVILANGMGGDVVMVGYVPDRIWLYPVNGEKNKRETDAVLAVYNDGKRDFAGCAAIVPALLWR